VSATKSKTVWRRMNEPNKQISVVEAFKIRQTGAVRAR
jgi:hypothetical protein